MKIGTILLAGISLILTHLAIAGEWSVEVDYADSCSCGVPCPCLFGGSPSKPSCLGQGFLTVTKGHYGDVDLTGVRAHVVYKMGSWESYTVCEEVSAEQFDAFRKVLELAFVMPGGELVGYQRGKISFEEKDGHIRFSTKDSVVDLEPVTGRDGSPIQIGNHPMFHSYDQYRSVKNSHAGEHAEFSQSGTNGFKAKRIHSSEDS